jgi:hypothetical protein
LTDSDVKILAVQITDSGMELVVAAESERRKGLGVAHSYFVDFAGERFGQQARDILDEIEDLAERVHVGWKREPKAEPDKEVSEE